MFPTEGEKLVLRRQQARREAICRLSDTELSSMTPSIWLLLRVLLSRTLSKHNQSIRGLVLIETSHFTDVNYLIAKFYKSGRKFEITAWSQHRNVKLFSKNFRQEICSEFSSEPWKPSLIVNCRFLRHKSPYQFVIRASKYVRTSYIK